MDWDADGAGAVISNRRSSPDTQELTTRGGCSARHVARCRTWECSTIQCYAESPHGATRLSGKQRVRTAVCHALKFAITFVESTPTGYPKRRRLTFVESTPTGYPKRRRLTLEESTPTGYPTHRRLTLEESTPTGYPTR